MRKKLSHEDLCALRAAGYDQDMGPTSGTRCPACGADVQRADLRTERARREVAISGLCQRCQDQVFEEEDEEDDPGREPEGDDEHEDEPNDDQ